MAKVLLLFTSMSGNTELIAEIIETQLVHPEIAVAKKQFDIDEISVEELSTYDGILLGTYTYGDGDLPYEVEDFYDALAEIDLRNTPVACFGSGDSAYPEFCAAIDTFSERFKEIGANVILPNLKIELDPTGDDVVRCEQFGFQFQAKLLSLNTLSAII